MKNIFLKIALFLAFTTINISAQEYGSGSAEKFGRTLNLGAGIRYYGYLGNNIPIVMLNYEFDIARNFTLAPFVGFYTNSNYYYWGDNNYAYRSYSYREINIPLGAKVAYYFDELFHASNKWDFYSAASLGVVFRTTSWDNGYYGDRRVISDGSPLFISLHVGSRYHINQHTGIFLDLSTGFSTVGVSFKL